MIAKNLPVLHQLPKNIKPSMAALKLSSRSRRISANHLNVRLANRKVKASTSTSVTHTFNPLHGELFKKVKSLCLNPKSPEYLPDADDEEEDTNIKNDMQNKFLNVYNIIQDMTFLEGVPKDIIVQTFKMAEINLFVEPKDLQKQYTYNDLTIELYNNNWEERESLFSILFVLLNYECLHSHQIQLITPHFIHKILHLLNSPDERERKMIEILVIKISDYNSCLKYDILKSLLSLFDDFENISNFFIISAAKIYLNMKYYAENNIHTFLRLFTHEKLCDFYDIVHYILIEYYHRDPSSRITSVNFLLKHWPISNSKSESCFIFHLIFLLKKYNLDLNENQKKMIENYIHKSLKMADNMYQSISVLQVMTEMSNLEFLLSFSKKMGRIIINDLFSLCNHWSESVSDLSKLILTFIHREKIEKLLENKQDNEDSEKKRNISWGKIYRMAKICK
ncbi:hypothetical protein TRFO_36403 [Tritrichomonas foetus]|uniref:Uncharacterized protein n=1 Tax=Tritrichomonas foetus TaxID=1144522 RepID=A0A1J4JDZ0_9EUKA|nr:hypothetical protein TRFO_36403 [Tritrichomonas foetus]|eukprot:OHS97370.1 hypothetical protein TRFO_36403 [Tritrichomonas foetus]